MVIEYINSPLLRVEKNSKAKESKNQILLSRKHYSFPEDEDYFFGKKKFRFMKGNMFRDKYFVVSR